MIEGTRIFYPERTSHKVKLANETLYFKT
jgi:hypothetical protein